MTSMALLVAYCTPTSPDWTNGRTVEVHALHGAGLLEPPVPHLDLGELVLGVGRSIGAHVLHKGIRNINDNPKR